MYVKAKTPEARRKNPVSHTRKPEFSQATSSPVNYILHLQQTIGNQAVQRLFADVRGPLSAISGQIQAKLKISQPNDIFESRIENFFLQRQINSYFQDPHKAFKRYKTLKKRLNYELRLIKRTRNRRLKKTRQIKFLKKIYDKVLGYNPFAVINVGLLTKTKTFRKGGYLYKVTTSDNAMTEWVDEHDKRKGIKVTFNKVVFTDPLESIIATALHESVHAKRLKSGVPYRSFARGITKHFIDAVTALGELDAYTIEIKSPFFRKLSRNRQIKDRALLREAEKDVMAALRKMNTFRHKSLQIKLEKLLPKFTGIKQWLSRHPFPWKSTTSTP